MEPDTPFNKKCDLHIHSIFSDSDADVESIFKLAGEKKLSCIAITDHDTVEAIEEAKLYSKITGIELIAAIELSAQKNDSEVHVLGYLIDPHHAKLKEALANMRELRHERLLLMIEKLNSLGMKVDKEEVLLKVTGTIPTRLHLALYLVEKGMALSLRQAFSKYLSPGKPGYVARFKYSVKEAIRVIKDCGGLAFLAHPHLLPEQVWIEEFIGYELDGLEVVYPKLAEGRASVYRNMANKFGLLKSGGSDAHGSYKEFTSVGGVTIPYEWVEEMKARKERRT